MSKFLSALIAALIGLALAATTAFAVVQSQTKAPNKNPASQQVVDYGNS